MTTKLKPDLVFVAAAMKAALFFLEIVNIDAKLFALIKYRRARAAFAGHAGEIIEGAQFLHIASAFLLAADKRRAVALDPKIRLRIPKADVLQHRAFSGAIRLVSVRGGKRFRSAHGKRSLHRRLLRIHAFHHAFLRRRADPQAFARACGSMRDSRWNQHDLARSDLDNAALALDRRAAGELQVD